MSASNGVAATSGEAEPILGKLTSERLPALPNNPRFDGVRGRLPAGDEGAALVELPGLASNVASDRLSPRPVHLLWVGGVRGNLLVGEEALPMLPELPGLMAEGNKVVLLEIVCRGQ